jgi:hypothetical protein
MNRRSPQAAELVRVVECQTTRESRWDSDFAINIYRDWERNIFFPVVFRRTLCRVRPSFVNTTAQEEIDLVDPAFGAARFARATVREVLDAVMKKLRGSGKRLRLIELVRTVELGPYDCPGEAPWYFIVKIYKELGKRKIFFPIVFRREFYRMRPVAARKLANEQVDIVLHDFDDERFVCASERAALARVVRHVRGKFEPAARRGGRRA